MNWNLFLNCLGLGLIALTLIRTIIDNRQAEKAKKLFKEHTKEREQNLSAAMNLHQARVDLRNDLQRIYAVHSKGINGTNGKPKHHIHILSKSIDEALQMLNSRGHIIENIYLNIDTDKHNAMRTQSFSFRIDYHAFESRERVVYFYNPIKNANYVKVKMLGEFKKIKDKYPSYKFTVSHVHRRSKETIF